MVPAPLRDAARLAAEAPEGGVLAPRDAPDGPAWLDLRGLPPELALARARRVGEAFGPSLLLGGSTGLFIAAGAIPPAAVAAALAAGTGASPGDTLRLAAVRGDDVLPRLEEFSLAGYDLLRSVPASLSGQAPVAAYADAPDAVIREAAESGAAVVVARGLDPRAAGMAQSGEPLHEPPETLIAIEFETGYRVTLAVDSADCLADARSLRLAGCSIATDAAVLRVEAARRSDLVEACRRFDLIVTGVAGPIEQRIVPTVVEHAVSLPSDLIEFGYQTRALAEWIDP